MQRSACKKRETALDLSQLGVVGLKGDPRPRGYPGVRGPPGTARAYASMNAANGANGNVLDD